MMKRNEAWRPKSPREHEQCSISVQYQCAVSVCSISVQYQCAVSALFP